MLDTIIVNKEKIDWLVVERGFNIPSFNYVTEREKIKGRPGSVRKSRNIDEITFDLPLIVRNDHLSPGGKKSHDEILKKLVEFFNHDEAVELRFKSQSWFWKAYFDGPIELPKNPKAFIKFTIKVVLLDPFKYSTNEYVNTAISDQISILNKGTVDTPVIIEARALKNSNYFMIAKGDEDYFMIGDDDVEKPPKDYSPNIYHSELQSLAGWSKMNSGSIPDNYLGGSVGGSYKVGSTGESFVVSSFPNGTGWIGAGYKRGFSKSVQDFQTTFKCIIYQKNKGAGRAVQHIYDTDNRLIASLGYENKYHDRKIGHFVVTLFNQSGDQVKIYDIQNTPKIYKMDIVVAYIRLKRVGNVFTVKSWLFDNNKDLKRTKPLDITEKKYIDRGNFYNRPISSINLYTAKYNGYDNMVMNLLGTFTTELLPKPVGANEMIIKQGDLVTIDTNTNNVLLNEEPFLHKKTFGSNFFNVKKGYSELLVYPERTFDTSIKWQDRYL